MNHLVKKVIKLFLLSLFLLYFLNALTDDIFALYLDKHPAEREFWILAVSNLALNVAILVSVSVFFIKRVSQLFKAEVQRQLDDRHLLYSSIAHDLKTPLSSVKGYSKALLDGRVKEEDREKVYQRIYRKTDEMNTLINALFEYANLSNENYQPEKVERNVSELVKESLAKNYDLIEQNEINLDMSIEDNLFAEIAPNEMGRVFDNLILNAISHNDKGINLEVGLKKNRRGWTFYVADSGAEIFPEDQKRIFEPFAKLDASRSGSGGSGLGLAIVKRIVENHKGSVRVSEDFPAYTKAFVVEIPQ